MKGLRAVPETPLDAGVEQLQGELHQLRDHSSADLATIAALRAQLADANTMISSLSSQLAKMREAYDLKVAEFARETERVGMLAKVLMDDDHSPDGFHAEGDRCRQCKALREAQRPATDEGANRG
jgi:hypothetical protein